MVEMAITVKIAVFRDVTPCRVVEMYRASRAGFLNVLCSGGQLEQSLVCMRFNIQNEG